MPNALAKKSSLYTIAITASLVAWLSLFIGYSAWRAHGFPLAAPNPVNISPSALMPVFGHSRLDGGEIIISALDEQGRALLAAPVQSLDAGTYPLLYYQLSGVPEYLQAALFWRTAQAPKQIRTLALPQPNGREQVLRLTQAANWRDQVIEVGIVLQSATGLPPPPLPTDIHVKALGFRGNSFPGSVQVVLTQWLAPIPWSGASANTVAAGKISSSEISPMRFAYAAMGLAAILATAVLFRQWRRLPAVIGVVALFGWIVLDGLWQHRLLTQNAYSASRFAGLSQDEKMRVDSDWPLYSQMQAIKAAIIRHGGGGRVFIDAEQGHYQQGRAKYHLLPLNPVASLDVWLHFLHAGDYLVVDQKKRASLKLAVDDQGFTSLKAHRVAPDLRAKRILDRPNWQVYAIVEKPR